MKLDLSRGAAQWLSRVYWNSVQGVAIKEKVQEILTGAKDYRSIDRRKIQ